MCKCDVSKSRFTLKYLLESLLLFCTTGSISFPCQNDNDKNYIMIMIKWTPVIADAPGGGGERDLRESEIAVYERINCFSLNI